jgi:cytochrome c556
MMSAKQWSLVLALGLIAASGMWSVSAQDEEEGPYDKEIQYRQALMKSIGGHVGATAALVSGRIAAPGHMKVHAAAIAGVSDDIQKFFPKDSTDEDSAAKPEIWKDWADFEKKAQDMHDAAVAYNRVVQADGSAADVRTAFKSLADSCKACHEDYRRKED